MSRNRRAKGRLGRMLYDPSVPDMGTTEVFYCLKPKGREVIEFSRTVPLVIAIRLGRATEVAK